MEFLSIFTIIMVVFGMVTLALAIVLTGGNRWATISITVSVFVALATVAALFERVNALAIITALSIVGAGAFLAHRIVINAPSSKEVKK